MKLQPYGIGGDYSLVPHDAGTVLLARDVLAAVEKMLDDDEQTVTLLLELYANLKTICRR
jgi:hypothetical protein